MDARATRRPRRRRGAVPGGERGQSGGRRRGARALESRQSRGAGRVRGGRAATRRLAAHLQAGARRSCTRVGMEGVHQRRASFGPGRAGRKAWLAGARVVRGRGAYGGCSAAPARGSERGARQSSSSGKSIRRSASGAELGATIDRCQMNTCGPEHHAVGEGRLGHGASLPARGRALGARVAARLGSGAPHLSVLSALRRPPTFKYSVDCDDAWRVAERRSSAVPLGIPRLRGARGR